MVTRLIIADAASRVVMLADWQHPDRLESFVLGNLPDGGTAYAVTVRTRAHFVDRAVPPAQRTADHQAMLREAREVDVMAFIGSVHRLVLDCTRRADGELEAHAAYAGRTETDGTATFATVVAMPDQVIDGPPRPLFRRVGPLFYRRDRGAWVEHDTDAAKHARLRLEGALA
jgi:hypothetical protein